MAPWSIQSLISPSSSGVSGLAFTSLSGGGMKGSFCLRGQLEQQALGALARHDRRPFAAALENRLRRFQHEVALRLGRAVAGQAVAAEDRQDFLLEIDVAFVLDFGDGDGIGLRRATR